MTDTFVDPLSQEYVDKMNQTAKAQDGLDFFGAQTSYDNADKSGVLDPNSSIVNSAINSGGGLLADAVNAVYKNQIQDTPGFKMEDHFKDLQKSGIPEDLYGRFKGVGSLQEMEYVKQDINDELKGQTLLQKSGFTGTAATLLNTVVDPTSALMFMRGGGLLIPKVAQKVEAATGSRILGRVAAGATAGAQYSAIQQGSDMALNPTTKLDDAINSIMENIVFGGVLGAVIPSEKLAQRAIDDTRVHLNDPVLNTTDNYDYGIYSHSEEHASGMNFGGINPDESVGAAKVAGVPDSGTPDYQPKTDKMLEAAQRYLDQSDEAIQQIKKDKATGMSRLANQLNDLVDKVPWLKTDFAKFYNSGSQIAKSLALKLMEDSSGGIRAGSSATLLMNKFRDFIARPGMVDHEANFREWLQENKLQRSQETQRAFGKAVSDEMDARYFDGAGVTSSKSVKAQADALDMTYENGLKVQQGKPGETSVKGSENLEWKSGWRPFRWQGSAIYDLERAGVKEASIIEALKNGYARMYPDWSPEAIAKTSAAVVRRYKAMEDGIDTSISRILDRDGREFALKYLTDSGIDLKEAEAIIDGLALAKADQGKVKILKHRNEIDPRTPIPGTQYTLSDLMEHNHLKTVQRYSRQAGGAAALARHGIQTNDWKDIKAAILDELKVNGKDGPLDLNETDIEGLRSAFMGGPTGAGVSPWVRRLLNTANLGILNSVGLTQFAETGAMVGAYGLDIFKRTAPKAVREMMEGKYSPAMKDLIDAGTPITGEHLLSRPDALGDTWEVDPKVQRDKQNFINQIMGSFDSTLQKLTRLQGYTSGFYAIHHMQLVMHGRGFLQYMGELAQGKVKASEARLYDMGFGSEPDFFNRVMKNFKDHVEYSEDGLVHDLHPEKWGNKDWDQFVDVHNRVAAQLVQKSLQGEGMLWMNSDMGAIMAHLRKFTILSLKKQLIRNMRIADPGSMAQTMFGLGTAAMVYVAKEVTSGRTDKLHPDEIAKGAIGLSNMTASIPSFVDPLGSLLGIDGFKFNVNTRPGIVGGQIIPTPPALGTLERMAHLPESMYSIAAGNYNKGDITSAQSLPIVGNLYGISAMFNGMKDDLDAAKKKPEPDVQDTGNAIEPSPKKKTKEPVSTPAPMSATDTIKKAQEMGQ